MPFAEALEGFPTGNGLYPWMFYLIWKVALQAAARMDSVARQAIEWFFAELLAVEERGNGFGPQRC
jgi:hypothetical protein